jgi:hypothetical protein
MNVGEHTPAVEGSPHVAVQDLCRMTNANMVNREAAKVAPNTSPLPEMPAPEDAARPTTREDPIDSPQRNESGQRAAPDEHKQGLATRR